MKKFIFTLGLFLFLGVLAAKAQRPLWLNAWGALPTSTGKTQSRGIASDAAGNIYAAGTITDTVASRYQGIWLTKYSSNGQIIWSKRWGGRIKMEISKLIIDINGSIYITGSFGSYFPSPIPFDDSINFDGHTLHTHAHGSEDIFWAKFDGEGHLKWVRCYGGNGTASISAVNIAASGLIYLAGQYDDTLYLDTNRLVRKSDNDIFLAEADTAGNLHWVKELQTGWVQNIGFDAARNFYLSGTFSGDYAWFGQNKTYSLNTGSILGSPYVVKYDSALNFKWVRLLNGSNSNSGPGSSGILYTGQMIVKPNGSFLLGGMYENCSVGFGSGPSVPQESLRKMFLVNYSMDANPVWVHTGEGCCGNIAADEQGNIYATAFVGAYSKFDSVNLSYPNSTGINNYMREAAVIKYDSLGIACWGVRAVGVGGDDYSSGVAFSPNGQRIYINGSTESPSIQFGPYSISNLGYGAAFVGVVATQPTGIAAIPLLPPSFQLLPNPAGSHVVLQLTQATTGIITVVDMKGAVLRSIPVAKQQAIPLSLEGLPAGVYSVQLQTAEGRMARQLVVQP